MSKLTIFEVKDAIKHLEAQAIKPTVLNIRKILGHGSFSSITKYLKEIKASALAPTPSYAPLNEAPALEDQDLTQVFNQTATSNESQINETSTLKNESSQTTLTHPNQAQTCAPKCRASSPHALEPLESCGPEQIMATGALIHERQQEIARLRQLLTSAHADLTAALKREATVHAEVKVLERLLKAVIIDHAGNEIPGDLKRALNIIFLASQTRPQSESYRTSLKKVTDTMKIFLK